MLKIKKFIKNNFLKGTIVILLSDIVASFFNYLYHLFTARLLLPEQYGLLQTFIALVYILRVFTQTFSFSIINQIGRVKKSLVLSWVQELGKQAIKFTLPFWLIFILLFPLFKRFFHLPNFLIYFIFTLQIIFLFLPLVYSCTLQARLKFISFSLLVIFESLIRNLSAFTLIILGFQVKGALGGGLVSAVASLLVGKFLVNRYWKSKSTNNKQRVRINRGFWNFSLLSLLTNLALVSIYSIDILLVRHFFSPYESGIYAAVSTLGKIIFFTSTSIFLVSFPYFIKFRNQYYQLKRTFIFSLLFIIFICLLGIIFYNLFPHLVVSFLYNQSYQNVAVLLPTFAIFISLYAIFNLMIQLLLALKNVLVVWFSGLVAIIQILLILIQHHTLQIIIYNSIISLCLGLLFTSIFVMKVINDKKNQ